MPEEVRTKQISAKLTDEQFDKLDTLCMQTGTTKQAFVLKAIKLLFLLTKGSYSVVDKNGNKVEII